MIVYLLLFLFINVGFLIPRNKYIFIAEIIILSIIVFFRDISVGTDVANYSVNFNKITHNASTWNYYLPFEPGFNYFILYFKYLISSNPLNCWGFIGVIYILSFSKFCRKYTKNRNITLSLFVLLGTFFLSFNIMRQCFAYTILLFLFSKYNLNKLNPTKKIFLLISIILCGILFHPTMYIFIIIFLFDIPIIQNLLTRKYMILSLLIISYICFFTQIIIPIFINLLEHFLIEGKLINYATRDINSGSGFSFIKAFLITLFQIYIVSISKNTRNIFLFLSTFGILFLNIFIPLVVEFARVYELFVVFQIIYLAQLWSDINYKTIKGKIYRITLICYSALIYFNILIKNYGEIIPYQFRF